MYRVVSESIKAYTEGVGSENPIVQRGYASMSKEDILHVCRATADAGLLPETVVRLPITHLGAVVSCYVPGHYMRQDVLEDSICEFERVERVMGRSEP